MDIDVSAVNTIIGSAGDINTIYSFSDLEGSFSGLGNQVLIINDANTWASALNSLDSNTSGIVNASSVNTITGTSVDLITAYAANAAGTITGLGNEGVSIIDTTINAKALNDIDGYTTGVVNASSVNTITGTAAEVIAAYAANSTANINGLGNEAVTITDTSINASVLMTLDAFTTGIINASSITTLTGSDSDQATVRASSGISGLQDLISSGRISAIDNLVNAIATLGRNNNSIFIGIAATGGSGSGATFNVAISTNGEATITLANPGNGYKDNDILTISRVGTYGGPSDIAVQVNGITPAISNSITLTAQTISAKQLIDLDTQYSGIVDAYSVNTITGTAAEVIAAYAANSAGNITGLGNEAVTLTFEIVPAALLNTINANTTGVVDVSAVNSITGTAADVIAAYSANIAGTVTGLGNEAITINDSLTVAQLNYLGANNDGVITATISEGDMLTLAGITPLGNTLAITVTDEVVVAAEINTLDSKTTTDLTVTSSTIIGTASDLIAAYTATGSINGLGDEAVTISDTTIDAAELKTLDALTTGIINALSITTLTGSNSDKAVVRASSGITGLPGSSTSNPITISAAQIASFIADPSSFVGYSAESHIIVEGAITPAQASELNSVDAVYIQATIAAASISSLAGIAVGNSSRTSPA